MNIPFASLRGSLRTASLLVLLSASLPAIASAAEVDKDKLYPPKIVPLPTAAEETALRAQKERDMDAQFAGFPNDAALRAAMQKMNLNPDDEIDRRVFQAEMNFQATQTKQDQPVDGITAVNAVGDFAPDPGWGNAGIGPDRYGGAYGDHSYRGIKGAKLPNGDVVVVGEIRDANGNKQLGITKRGSNGARKLWTSMGPVYDLWGDKNYFVWPHTDTTVPPIYEVRDVKVYNNFIYVLVTGIHTVNSAQKYWSDVIRLDLNGGNTAWWYASQDGSETQDAVAMDIAHGDLIVLGRYSVNTSGGFWTARWDINSSGDLTNVRWGSYPTINGSNQIEPADIVFRQLPGLFVPAAGPDAYILFTQNYTAPDRDPRILAAKPDGSIDTTFGSSGIYYVNFDDPESTKGDVGIAISANAWGGGPFTTGHEGIQVVVKVPRKTKNGIGIFELYDRAQHPNFGGGTGKIVFGGCGVATVGGTAVGEGCYNVFSGSAEHTPTDIALIDTYTLVSGYSDWTGGALGGSGINPILAKVHGDSGAVVQLDKSGFSTGSGTSNAMFNSLVPKSNDYVVGIGRFLESGNTDTSKPSQLMMGLQNNDIIFKNGFD